MSIAHPSSPRILIAAEHPLEAQALESMLSGAGHRNIRVTSDAREIAPLHAKWPYRLLVLDLKMLSQAGVEAFIDRQGLSVLLLTPEGQAASPDVITRPLLKDTILLQVDRALRTAKEPALNRRPF